MFVVRLHLGGERVQAPLRAESMRPSQTCQSNSDPGGAQTMRAGQMNAGLWFPSLSFLDSHHGEPLAWLPD